MGFVCIGYQGERFSIPIKTFRGTKSEKETLNDSGNCHSKLRDYRRTQWRLKNRADI